jgi:ribosomal protein S18 acetylase RimI-like enzyme
VGNVREAILEDAGAIAEIHVAAWQETYRGLLPSGLLDSLEPSEKLGLWQEVLSLAADRDDLAVCVAEVGGGRIGFASMRPQPDSGLRAGGYGAEISALYVLKRAQGRGLGRELMRWLAVRIGAAGLDGAALWALESNKGARSFYEALGGEPVAARLEDRGGAEVRAVAYGWRDLSALGAQ